MPKKLAEKEVIERFRSVHGERYNYSLVRYNGANSKLKIICPVHGIFEQTYAHHFSRKDGCPKCKYEKLSKVFSLKKKKFIQKANEIHNNKYDYSLVDYKNNSTKVKIICPIHGIFEQTPHNHVHGKEGCPFCKKSKGEEFIRSYLLKNNYKFISEYSFKDSEIKNLKFDFYLPELNIAIEFDGEQHYRFPNYFHKTYHDFLKQKHYDWLKRKFCKKHNIKLIRITYKDNILQKLKKGL